MISMQLHWREQVDQYMFQRGRLYMALHHGRCHHRRREAAVVSGQVNIPKVGQVFVIRDELPVDTCDRGWNVGVHSWYLNNECPTFGGEGGGGRRSYMIIVVGSIVISWR